MYQVTASKKDLGFTLIELLMVVMLLGILAAIGISQFQNFSVDAKNATVKANVAILRAGISVQNAQMRIRCNVSDASFPPLDNIQNNDITNGGAPCTTTQVTNAQDRVFVNGAIPDNVWTVDPSQNRVHTCGAGGCTDRTTNCEDGAARDGTQDGWCYDEATGQIWANTSNNDGTGITGTENSY